MYDNNDQYNNNSDYYRVSSRKPGLFRAFIFALIGAVVGGLIVAYFSPVLMENNIGYHQDGQQPNITIEPQGQDLSVASAVAQKAMPSVVGVTTVTVQRDLIFGILRKGQGVGSGIIVNPDGYILTNDHVINSGQAEKITVLFNDGTEKEAKVLWHDYILDLAVLKVDAKNLTAADLGDSDKLVVGEMAVAIGNPLGLEFQRSVTAGIISGLHRNIQISQNATMEDLIQTDASINPGNSGGPLLNAKGEVIGLNSAKISSTEAEGLGFAIPINQAKPIIEQVIDKGTFTMVYLGIIGDDIQVIKEHYNIDFSVDQGVYIWEVQDNSPASRAGIANGDIITGINGNAITGMNQLRKELYKYKPGDEIQVTVSRNGKEKKVDVKLSARPDNY